jgi:outer membrane protein assembly factor BamB
MAVTTLDVPSARKPIRLWPGVVAASLLLLVRFGFPLVRPGDIGPALFGAIIGAGVILLWWLFFSRERWSERLAFVAVIALTMLATYRILDVSIRTGAMGFLFPLLAIPGVTVALVAGAAAGRRLSDASRRAVMTAAIVLASGGWALIRTGGFTANFHNDFMWRWSQSPEERLVAQSRDLPFAPAGSASAGSAPASIPVSPAATPAAPAASAPLPVAVPATPTPAAAATRAPEWPGFRGPERDSVIRDVRIETDWAKTPPVVLWRRPIGPGWSSFAVDGGLIYTQEQRGDDEIVACYSLATGEPVWMHRDAARFWESNGGAGPRGTPTLDNGRVYALGATGLLNALDARTGAVIWSRNAAADTGAELPGWGFSSSPIVLDDMVIVATAGRLAAYDLAAGRPRWLGPARGGGYSSPQPVTIDGVRQVVLMSTKGATSVAPADGAVLWQHDWSGTPIVQPASIGDGDLLITTSNASGADGIRRLAVAQANGRWTVTERWMSAGLKPYFNDFVIHKGHAFGFDGSILSCIDLADGKRVWKGGRYGNGQLVLLADQDVLLVTSEEGELALVSAGTDEFKELARFPGVDGKTWNHPVLVHDVLLVRNGAEMVAFRLALASR